MDMTQVTVGAGSSVSGSAAAIAPCAFQLDVQWILDIIDKVQSSISKLEQLASNVLNIASDMLSQLSGILSWFCWIGPVKWAKNVVEAACWAIEKAIAVTAKMYNQVLEAMKHVLAPWEVRSAGEQIRDQLAPKCADFAEMLHAGNLRSGSSWTGDAADLFRQKLGRQNETGVNVADAAMTFGDTVQEIGADGVKTTVTFVTQMVTALGGLALAIAAMAAPPVGTVAGASAAIGLVAAIFAYIMVYVDAMMGIIRQTTELGNAASGVPGGQWPAARI